MFFNQTEKDDVSSTVDAVFYELKEGEFQEFNDIVEIWVLTNNDIIDKISLDFPSLTFFKWGRYGADVLPSGRSKASGIEKIIQLQNYDLANTFAVGDASNDIPMFKLVNTSICMGQAKDEIKKEATFVTTSIDDDGLAYAIYNYILEK
jgi:hypothetical protein